MTTTENLIASLRAITATLRQPVQFTGSDTTCRILRADARTAAHIAEQAVREYQRENGKGNRARRRMAHIAHRQATISQAIARDFTASYWMR